MKYAFTTLAIGTAYNYKVRTLIDCVLELTCGDIIVITDDLEDINAYLDKNTHLDTTRVFVVDYSTVCVENKWYKENRAFNFNLKRLPVTVASTKNDYDMIVHADADAFFIGWDEAEFQRFVSDMDAGMLARFRNRPGEEHALFAFLDSKSRQLGFDINSIKSRLAIEVFMFFKPKHPNFKKFLEEWEEITNLCYNRGIDPFVEALEISYALDKSELPHEDIIPLMRKYPILKYLRYLHHDKIMKII